MDEPAFEVRVCFRTLASAFRECGFETEVARTLQGGGMRLTFAWPRFVRNLFQLSAKTPKKKRKEELSSALTLFGFFFDVLTSFTASNSSKFTRMSKE